MKEIEHSGERAFPENALERLPIVRNRLIDQNSLKPKRTGAVCDPD
ncbi:hypothetical protein ACFONL_12125 [Camelimonas fluminis]|uniref:Uncharacterized protein n=1 Tax=Camelimonas fluminis TaxID=1576911 RepID=A0ABV7UHV3_9HYPH|nr:hypothetical protein [Camelimonas fluminis]